LHSHEMSVNNQPTNQRNVTNQRNKNIKITNALTFSVKNSKRRKTCRQRRRLQNDIKFGQNRWWSVGWRLVVSCEERNEAAGCVGVAKYLDQPWVCCTIQRVMPDRPEGTRAAGYCILLIEFNALFCSHFSVDLVYITCRVPSILTAGCRRLVRL